MLGLVILCAAIGEVSACSHPRSNHPHLAGSSQARLPLFPGNELANIEQVMSVCRVELETKVREVFTVPEEGIMS